MPAPTPRTWTVGEGLTAAKLNTDLRDGLNFLLAPPRAELYRTVNQAVANSSLVAIGFDAEVIDSDGGHSTSTNNSRYTAQTAGWFDCVCQAWWDTTASSSFRSTAAYVNGGSFARRTVGGLASVPTYSPIAPCVATLFLNVGDYVEFKVLQLSGASVNVAGGVEFTNATYFWRSK
jgi:hypothetical protein